MNDIRNSFVFYRSWYEAMRRLPVEMRDELFITIMEYALYRKEPKELCEAEENIWGFVKPLIDANQMKFEAIYNKKSCAKSTNTPKPVDASKEREKERSKEKEKEVGNVNGNEEKKKLNSESLAKKTRFSLTLSQDEKKMKSEDDMMVRMTAFYETLLPYVRIYGREMVRDFFDYWTEPTPSGTRMRFELQKTWSLERRLKFWESNERIKSKKLKEDNGGKAKITYI